ncbi:MAG: SUMF1/EgtB/PvdO family nonheme iron enzyme [Fibrobacteria bacterium]
MPKPLSPLIGTVLLLPIVSAWASLGPRPVAQGKPNAFGLYDMAGNVLEWTGSAYDKAYLDKEVREEDGHFRVLRGGSWLDAPFNLRSADRQPLEPQLRDSKYGFRCALPLSASDRAPAGMKAIPAGKYAMGSLLASDEQPVHDVSVDAFYLDTTEVTQARFQAVMGYNPSRFKAEKNPVERVNWFDAIRYANALSKAAGLDTAYAWDSVCDSCSFYEYAKDALFATGLGKVLSKVRILSGSKGYRLPSEEEWEYAARAGSSSDFYWGKKYGSYPASSDDFAELGAYAAWRGNAFDRGGPEPMSQENVPAAPLPDPAIKVVRCSTSTQLLDLFYRGMKQPLTILLKDGEYDLAYWLYGTDGNGTEILVDKAGTTIMGESKDPRKVIIRGRGFNSSDYTEELLKVQADNVTLAYFTLKDIRANGIKIQGSLKNLRIHNIHFEDIGERCIKAPNGTASNLLVSRDVTVSFCAFSQFTEVSEDRAQGERNGLDYIGGIDVMRGQNWHIHDNLFRNIRGATGLGRAGIFFWINSKSLLIERNMIWKCDRGIALGNPSGSDFDYHVDSALVRNNLLLHTRSFAVEACSASHVRIYNNAFYSDLQKPMAVHLWRNKGGNALRNNFVVGTVSKDGNGAYPDTSNNYWSSAPTGQKDWFKDPARGDLHITPKAVGLIDRGADLPEVPTDWDGKQRLGKPDIGIDEFASIRSAVREPEARPGSPYLSGYSRPGGGSLVFTLANPRGQADFAVYGQTGRILWSVKGLRLEASGGRIVWPMAMGAHPLPGRFVAVLTCEDGRISRLVF